MTFEEFWISFTNNSYVLVTLGVIAFTMVLKLDLGKKNSKK